MSAFERAALVFKEGAEPTGLASHVIEETLARMAPEMSKGSITIAPAKVSEFLMGLDSGGLNLNLTAGKLQAYSVKGESGLAMHTLVERDGGQLSISPSENPRVAARVFGLSMMPDGRTVGTNFPGRASDPVLAKLPDFGLRLDASSQSVVSFLRPGSVQYLPGVGNPKGLMDIATSSAYHGREVDDLVPNAARELSISGDRAWEAGQGVQVELKGMKLPTNGPETVKVMT
jgi:hypothetical protein